MIDPITKATLFVNQVIQTLCIEIEAKLFAILKQKGFEVNEQNMKRITRIDLSTIGQLKNEFWLDYNTDNRTFLFLCYMNYDQGTLCFEFSENKGLSGSLSHFSKEQFLTLGKNSYQPTELKKGIDIAKF